MIKYDSTALFTDDVRKSAEFYKDLIGLEILMDNVVHIAFTGGLNIWDKKSADSLIFGSPQPMPEGCRMELCFSSEDVEADYKRMKSAGAEILNTLAEQPWSQLLFRIKDPDGNIVEIAESITDTFIRLKNSGLTLEQISEKTHTSVDDLQKFITG
jgi:catechol 2,3-dioxygenase-like lactoylglutathione lyase family enzyme